MFKKICLFFSALSIIFSAESFAVKSTPHEPGLEKKSSKITKRRMERPVTRRSASRAARQKAVELKRARIAKKQERHTSLTQRRTRASGKLRGKPAARSIKNNSSNVNINNRNTGTIVRNGSLVASTNSNNVSSVNINGRRITGRNIKVINQPDGSYIIDADGKQTVVDKPSSVSVRTTASSTTKSRNGRIKKQSTASATNYSFTTNSNIGPSFDSVASQKQMDEMRRNLEKELTKINFN